MGSTIGSGSVGTTVATAELEDDSVTYAKIQNVSATDKVLGRSTAGAGDVEEITCTAAGRALLDDADATAQRVTLGLVIGTNVQAQDAELAALAGLTSAADKLPYFTGSGTAALADITAAGRAILDDADATAQRATLGISSVDNAFTISQTITHNQNGVTGLTITNTDTGNAAIARLTLASDAAGGSFSIHGTGEDLTLFGVVVADMVVFRAESTASGMVVGTLGTAPLRIGTNNTAAITIDGSTQAVSVAEASGNVTAKGFTSSDGGVVTQASSITTGVTLNTTNGQITTVTGPAIAAGAEAAFTVTNSTVAATSIVLVSVATQFSDGDVIAYVKSIASGSFVISLTNVGAAAVSAGTAVINFIVFGGSAT